MLKLGTETGSLINHVMSRQTIGQPAPTIGMGATILCWTDRHAATIIEVFASHGAICVIVQQDKARRTDDNGMSESQSYRYEPNPVGAKYTFRRGKKSGGWHEVIRNPKTSRWNKCDGQGLRIGAREEYRDFSF